MPTGSRTKRGRAEARRWRKVPVTPEPPERKTARTVIHPTVIPVEVSVRESRPHPDTGTKRDERCPPVKDVSWRRSKNDSWVIHRHIDHLRVGWHDLDDGVGHINNLSFEGPLHYRISDDHYLLWRCLQCAGRLCFGAQKLNRIHQFQRLFREGFPQFDRPVQVVAHVLNHLWKPGHRFYIVIPWLIINPRKVVGVSYEACRLDNLHGIHRRRQHNGNQRIRVKRDRCGQFLQILVTALGRRRKRGNGNFGGLRVGLLTEGCDRPHHC
jgi:hypothetical protein